MRLRVLHRASACEEKCNRRLEEGGPQTDRYVSREGARGRGGTQPKGSGNVQREAAFPVRRGGPRVHVGAGFSLRQARASHPSAAARVRPTRASCQRPRTAGQRPAPVPHWYSVGACCSAPHSRDHCCAHATRATTRPSTSRVDRAAVGTGFKPAPTDPTGARGPEGARPGVRRKARGEACRARRGSSPETQASACVMRETPVTRGGARLTGCDDGQRGAANLVALTAMHQRRLTPQAGRRARVLDSPTRGV